MQVKLSTEQLHELRSRAERTRQQKETGSSGGGFQSYLESLDDKTTDAGDINLTDYDFEQIRRYIQYDDGQGGYEHLFRRIFGDIVINDIIDDCHI